MCLSVQFAAKQTQQRLRFKRIYKQGSENSSYLVLHKVMLNHFWNNPLVRSVYQTCCVGLCNQVFRLIIYQSSVNNYLRSQQKTEFCLGGVAVVWVIPRILGSLRWYRCRVRSHSQARPWPQSWWACSPHSTPEVESSGCAPSL